MQSVKFSLFNQGQAKGEWLKGWAKKISYHGDHGAHREFLEVFSVISVRSACTEPQAHVWLNLLASPRNYPLPAKAGDGPQGNQTYNDEHNLQHQP